MPVLSFITGYFTNKASSRDIRHRLSVDIELWKSLPAESERRVALLRSIDDRIEHLAQRSEPRRTTVEVFTNGLAAKDRQGIRFALTRAGQAASLAVVGGVILVLSRPAGLVGAADGIRQGGTLIALVVLSMASLGFAVFGSLAAALYTSGVKKAARSRSDSGPAEIDDETAA